VDSFLGIRYAQPPTGRLRWVTIGGESAGGWSVCGT
jgi:carboxylesterase type B